VTTTDIRHDEAPIYGIAATRLDGTEDHLANYRNQVLLIVNVASLCGRTPQYEDLQRLYTQYSTRGFAVLGFPCNQFGEEEPGGAQEISQFCATTYGVTFPMFGKINVNGASRHPLYRLLAATPYDDTPPADIGWNFEKFLVGRDGSVIRRFRYTLVPSDPMIVKAIEEAL
jgi:glutathione peroxidase